MLYYCNKVNGFPDCHPRHPLQKMDRKRSEETRIIFLKIKAIYLLAVSSVFTDGYDYWSFYPPLIINSKSGKLNLQMLTLPPPSKSGENKIYHQLCLLRLKEDPCIINMSSWRWIKICDHHIGGHKSLLSIQYFFDSFL